jgi:hypothetical protein
MEKEPNIIDDEEKRKEVEQAILVVGEIKQQVAIMGANDFEIPALDNILRALNESQVTAQEAIKEATLIRDRKSDYH